MQMASRHTQYNINQYGAALQFARVNVLSHFLERIVTGTVRCAFSLGYR